MTAVKENANQTKIKSGNEMDATERARKMQKEAMKQKKNGKIRGSAIPFLAGAATAVAASYFMKSEKGEQVKGGMGKMKSQAKDMIQDKDITNVIKENKENATQMAEAFKEKLPNQGKQSEKNGSNNQPKNQQNDNNNENTETKNSNPAKNPETGGQ